MDNLEELTALRDRIRNDVDPQIRQAFDNQVVGPDQVGGDPNGRAQIDDPAQQNQQNFANLTISTQSSYELEATIEENEPLDETLVNS